MNEDYKFVYEYESLFSELEEVTSDDYDVRVNCQCGISFDLYSDGPIRCSSCGRVYKLKTFLYVGDKIVSQEDFDIENKEREKRRLKTLEEFKQWLKDNGRT